MRELYDKIRDMLDRVLTSLDPVIGSNLVLEVKRESFTDQGTVRGTISGLSTTEEQILLDLLVTCLECIPRITPSLPFIELACKYTLHVDENVRNAARATLNRASCSINTYSSVCLRILNDNWSDVVVQEYKHCLLNFNGTCLDLCGVDGSVVEAIGLVNLCHCLPRVRADGIEMLKVANGSIWGILNKNGPEIARVLVCDA